MKIICDCGNICTFNTKDEETGLENEFEDEEMYGQYARKEGRFNIWEMHDVVGIECNNCKKAIWMFV